MRYVVTCREVVESESCDSAGVQKSLALASFKIRSNFPQGNPSVTTSGLQSPCDSPTIEIKVPPIKTLARLKEKESHLGLSPGKPDIASWISSSVDSQMLDDTIDDNGANFVWRRDFATSEWAEALGYASRQLLSSHSNVRIPFLREDLLTLVKHEGTCFQRCH